MKSNFSLAAAIVVSLAAATASSAFAQSSAPGARPPRSDNVAAVRPPPPPRGPDKLTQTRPWDPRGFDSAKPTPADDFAPRPNTEPSTCHAVDITFGNCAASLLGTCVKNDGDFSCTDDSCTCTYK